MWKRAQRCRQEFCQNGNFQQPKELSLRGGQPKGSGRGHRKGAEGLTRHYFFAIFLLFFIYMLCNYILWKLVIDSN